MRWKSMSPIAAAIALSACAGAPPLADVRSDALTGKRLAVAQRPSPELDASHLRGDVVTRHRLEDPAGRVGQNLAGRMGSEFGMAVLPSRGKAAGDDVAGLIGAYPDADYIIDIGTSEWSIKGYWLNYSAQMRLISVADGRVVAESACHSAQGDDDNPPSAEQLSNDGAILSSYLDRVVAHCVDFLSADVLQLNNVVSTASSSAVASEFGVPQPITARDPIPMAPPIEAPAAPAPTTSRPAIPEQQQDQTLSPAARAAGQSVYLRQDTPFRASPRLPAPATLLRAGTEVIVRQRVRNAEGEWWFISVPGDIGWIPSPEAAPAGR